MGRPWTGALPSGVDPAAGGTSKLGTFYTSKGSTVYAIFFSYPQDSVLTLSVPHGIQGQTNIQMLTVNGPSALKWTHRAAGGINVELPPPPLGSFSAWTLKLTGVGLEGGV